MDDITVEKSMRAIDGLVYAERNDLDINKKEDVEKIIKYLGLEGKEDPKEFMELLQTAESAMDLLAKKIEEEKKDLPN